ncbi:MAG: D-alanyl-D-alanine carboxypeptidase family protein [Acutalibacteraceae bacterium]|jgi:LAS superfamily LD-carboxypeptidase LdcB
MKRIQNIAAALAALTLALTALGGCGGEQPLPDEKPSTTAARPGQTTTTAAPTASRTAADTTATAAPTTAAQVAVTGLTLDVYEVTVAVGQSKMPWVTMSPENATDKSEIWTSSDETVATVDGIGNITGKKEGTCVVTVKAAAAPSVKAEVKVTVTPAPKTTAPPAGETIEQMVERISSKAKEPTYIQGILIANKTYGLPRDFNPGASPEMLAAFSKMQKAAAAQGLTLYDSSDFRTYDLQVTLYTRYCRNSGQAAADTYSARPGYSEHQTGLVIDLNTVEDSFGYTAEAAWVAKNAHKYGFIVRYPKGKEAITGYQYEPWHIRYLGVDTATAVYNSGKTLEEYLGITSVYAD